MERFRVGSDTIECELSIRLWPADCFYPGCAMADALHGTSLVEKY
ncbi:MAG TPA: hypothetical protein VGO04_11745 [Ensifer sp.]|jgi:hypothetical protein|nr:hypothetical protein [Ensifer sp.]